MVNAIIDLLLGITLTPPHCTQLTVHSIHSPMESFLLSAYVSPTNPSPLVDAKPFPTRCVRRLNILPACESHNPLLIIRHHLTCSLSPAGGSHPHPLMAWSSLTPAGNTLTPVPTCSNRTKPCVRCRLTSLVFALPLTRYHICHTFLFYFFCFSSFFLGRFSRLHKPKLFFHFFVFFTFITLYIYD